MKYLLMLLIGCNLDYQVKGEHNYYPPSNVNFTLEALEQVDTYIGPTPNPVDVLFVIDRSCSMLDDMDYLALNSWNFFSTLREFNLDYRVGVTTTDAENAGELSYAFGDIRFISSKYENPEGVFFDMLRNSIGDGESGFAAIRNTFTSNNDLDFYRMGVPLRIIIISDEDDSSDIKSNVLINFLENKVEPRRGFDVGISGVLYGETQCSGFTESSGIKYSQLINHFNGTVVDICQMNWADVLSDLVLFSIQDQDSSYFLTENPLAETIEVHIIRNGATIVLLEELFVYNEVKNNITISDFEIANNDMVEIVYKIKR
jgi:hypothetical protein